MVSTVLANDLINYLRITDPNDRGLNIYHMTELRRTSAVDKWGKLQNVPYQDHWFSLGVEERIDIARYSAMVFGVINSRKNRISSLEWQIVPASREFDRMADQLHDMHQIWNEYKDLAAEPKYAVFLSMISAKLKSYMPDLRPDLVNFGPAFQRWRKKNKWISEDEAGEYEEWLKAPNQDYTFSDYLKLWVDDLHTHGVHALYKEERNGRLENFYSLPGGTVFPVHNRSVGGMTAYVQLTADVSTPQVFFQNEVMFSRWMPSTAMSYGLVPLEALVNKVAEQLLFDALAADQADGTKPPEKVVAISSASPFGDPDDELTMPINTEEQHKVETVINEKRKEAIRTLTGYGKMEVLDLSKMDIFQHQSDRQRQLREDTGFVFGATNMEMNLTGSGDTSGRSTSESQERMEQKRGVQPILEIITQKLNREVIPYRTGSDRFKFQFSSGLSEAEEVELWTKKLASGLSSVNEIRTEDQGKDPWPEDEYDRPPQVQAPVPGQDMQNPLVTSQVD